MTLPIRSLCALLGVLAVGMHSSAMAQTSPYCERVRARAQIDTAQLFAPKLHAQVVRNPAVSDVVASIGHGVQLRFGASWAPLDTLRGVRVLDLTRADCALHAVVERGERAAAFSPELLLVEAYAAQAAELESTREERERMLAKAQERLRDHLITVVAFHELQRHVFAIARKYEEARGVVARARAQGVERPPEALGSIRRAYESSSATFERKSGAVRTLDPWSLRVLGGVIPSRSESVDWYGWVEVAYSLGGLVHRERERHYQQARANEVRVAESEVPARVDTLTGQIEQRVIQAERELALVERQLALVAATLRGLQNPSSGDVEHVRDGLLVERMLYEGDRAFLLALLSSLSPLRSNGHDSPN